MSQYFFIIIVITSIFLGLKSFLKATVLFLIVNRIVFYLGGFSSAR